MTRDKAGNGTKDDPEGRCDAIMTLRDALGPDASSAVPEAHPAPKRPPMSQACQLGYHHECCGETTLGTSKCKCDCHAGAR